MKNKMTIAAIASTVILAVIFFLLKNNVETGSISMPNDSSATTNNNVAAPQESMVASPKNSVVPVDMKTLVKPHSPVKGAKNAKVIVVEYLDPECEACGAMYPYVNQIFEKYQNEIQLVVRYMTYHRNSEYVANLLEGARAQNKYWEALKIVFESQSIWASHNNPAPEKLNDLLKPLGLNIDKLVADAKSGKYNKQIQEDVQDGKIVGVEGTPTFYVNGQMVLDLGYEPLDQAIQNAINQTK